MAVGRSRAWDRWMRPEARRLALAAAASVFALCAGTELSYAQSAAKGLGFSSPAPAANAAPTTLENKERMVVDAQEIVHDNKNNTVSAVGSVQIFHQGRTIEADKVVYDRTSKRVVATGNARITESNGTVITGDKFDLTDDFKNGFIDSMRVENPDKTRFTAPRAERTDGQGMTFESGIYTACEPCKDNPEKPPLWQVRSARIIHDGGEKMVYYEGNRVEFWGVPIAYIPYFSAPDATVKRKSGFLAPHYLTTTAMGYGVAIPYFWNIAPNYDLTVTPTFLSRQGVLGQAEWRHRLINGSYNIRVAGISQLDNKAFLATPVGSGDRTNRGSIETTGKFYINEKWSYGWDIAMATDRWFITNYRLRSESLTSVFFKESTSTVFLNGKTDTGWFDMRGYYFRTLYYTDWQKQQAIVHPVIDYDKRYKGPGWLGGEVAVNANVTSLSREATAYQQIPRTGSYLFSFPNALLYETCAVYKNGSCIVRGVGGTTSRATIEASWRRNITDSYGQVWTPYASLRANGVFADINTDKYVNGQIKNFMDPGRDAYGTVMPTAGLMYRFPFVATSANYGTHIIEPIAQIAARPNESRIRTTINDDAQSLVFDDTNLFAWNKFSGYDRTEGGVRANVGAQYTGQFTKDMYTNLMFGQSYRVAGTNSFNPGDLANTGRNSGLEQDKSDYVARAQFAPSAGWLFSGKGRFDQTDFQAKRLEFSGSRSIGAFSTTVGYARYERQPELGLDRRREGLYMSQSVKFYEGWTARAGVLLDMDKYLLDRERFISNYNLAVTYPTVYSVPAVRTTGVFYPTTMTAGLQYRDECTIFDISYTKNFADRQAGAKKDGYTLLFRLELRTLGQINYTQRFGSATNTTSDGVAIP
jgi:LPS-assembly protein